VASFLAFLCCLAWLCLQFRPAREKVWARRWATYWAPAGKVLVACLTMTYQGFFRDPLRRLWNRQTAGEQVDDAINKILGRE
jgi:hypothetical protein